MTGASSGLGRHFAQVLGKAGMHVAVAARRLPHLEALEQELNATGHVARAFALDVTDEKSIDSAITNAEQTLGPVHVLVNAAGVTLSKPALEQSTEDWDRVIDTNLRGAFLMSMAAARRARAAERPLVIINIVSVLGIRQAGSVAPYAVSKAGLIQLTRCLALELARHDIRVNAIAPGYVRTDINEEFLSSAAGSALIKRIPQRRLGELSDFDGTLLLLASDASRYITGEVIAVDGGHLVSSL
ncbi:MAG TPA: SDR family NAD(P)-dependent oxidoreductase [Steroidobacteraceae bacterium]|nr:SDR family NAD(P)-dependent oxidoreductase [Steroidobacteraceae bacterium]